MGRDGQPVGACPRCLELEDEVAALRERLRRAGLLIAMSPGPNPVPDGEAELRRWLAEVASNVRALKQSIGAAEKAGRRRVAASLQDDLEAELARQEKARGDRAHILERAAAWQERRQRARDVVAWVRTLRAKLPGAVDAMPYEIRRKALAALGVHVTLYLQGHRPRYEIVVQPAPTTDSIGAPRTGWRPARRRWWSPACGPAGPASRRAAPSAAR
jgi:hypothetical protein